MKRLPALISRPACFLILTQRSGDLPGRFYMMNQEKKKKKLLSLPKGYVIILLFQCNNNREERGF